MFELTAGMVFLDVYEAHVAEAAVRRTESHGPESGPEIGPQYDTNICEEVPLLRCCLCALQA